MTEAVAKGVREVVGVDLEIYRVPELIPDDMLEKCGVKTAQKAYEHIPFITAEKFAQSDGVLFGTPSRFGNMSVQMHKFLDQLAALWSKQSLAHKVGSFYTNIFPTRENEASIINQFLSSLLKLGMITVSAPNHPYRVKAQDEIKANIPYNSALAFDEKRMPTESELAFAHFHGKHVATIARDLKQGRNKTC